jgi:hypothetical protein
MADWQKLAKKFAAPVDIFLAASPVRIGAPGTQQAVSCGHFSTQNTRFAAKKATKALPPASKRRLVQSTSYVEV